MLIKSVLKDGSIKIYEYNDYYNNKKISAGYYTCPDCGATILNIPNIINYHKNKSKKCKNICSLKNNN